jgi:hypothetical protein
MKLPRLSMPKLPKLNLAVLLHSPGLLLRLGACTLLTASIGALLYGLVDAWRHDPLQQLTPPPKSQAQPVPEQPALEFYPAVPTLPDLHLGYLFNAERNLAGRGRSGNTIAAANVHELVYAGSIILGKNSKALLTLPVAAQSSDARPGAPARSGSAYFHVAAGDSVGGYTVSEILPKKIVFKKGTEVVEKNLFDPRKQRTVAETVRPGVPAVAAAPAPEGAPPAATPQPTTPAPRAPVPRATTPRSSYAVSPGLNPQPMPPPAPLPPPQRNAPTRAPLVPPPPPLKVYPSEPVK